MMKSVENFTFLIHHTTFVKHFISNSNYIMLKCIIMIVYAGYGNTTSAINAVQFKCHGNIDSGKIKLYGIKDS